MSDMVINIAKDFTRSPGGRYKRDGSFSGESFRDDILVPKIRAAMAASGRVVVELDGTFGYASSFLDEAFAGLIREGHFDRETLSKVLLIHATMPHVQYYKMLAEQFMGEAAAEHPARASA